MANWPHSFCPKDLSGDQALSDRGRKLGRRRRTPCSADKLSVARDEDHWSGDARPKDETTGEELATVYVPTSPNPTSGYIEIVSTRNLTFTDWTFDQAMSFVITGGSNAPDTIAYHPKEGGKDKA